MLADTPSLYGVPTTKVVETVWSTQTGGASAAIKMFTFRLAGEVPDCPFAVALMEYVPEAVGVPLTCSLELPEGSALSPGAVVLVFVIDVALFASRVAKYGVPTLPFGKLAVLVHDGAGGAATDIEKFLVSEPPELEAVRLKL